MNALLEAIDKLRMTWGDNPLHKKLYIQAGIGVAAFFMLLVLGPLLSPEKVPVWWVVSFAVDCLWVLSNVGLGLYMQDQSDKDRWR
jgi:hypothetical protein